MSTEITGFNVPILLLLFNRPDTTREVFNVIKEVKPRKLYVAADGPRLTKPGEVNLCQVTRNIIKNIDWECELKTLYRDENLGCKDAVTGGISWFFKNEEAGIILEDDCLPNLSFFSFCEELLDKYKNNDEIMLIGGHNFLAGEFSLNSSYFFSHYPHIWGWATWRRAWEKYDGDISGLDFFIKNKLPFIYKTNYQRKFLLKNLYLVKHLKFNTWDYQWGYTILNNNGLAITPMKNMIINLGFRNQSTHTFLRDKKKEISVLENLNFPLVHPTDYKVNSIADYITFSNVMSKRPKRFIRLLLENNIFDLIKFFIRRFLF